MACEEKTRRACGKETSIIGYDESNRLEAEPARYFVRVIKREKRACRCCEQATVTMAPLEPRIVEMGLASHSVVIATEVSKYSDHQPLYRQAVILDLTSLYYPTVTAAGSFGNMPAKMPIAAMQYDVNGRLNGLTMDDQDGRGPLAFANASYYPAGQLSTLRVQGWLETRMYNSLIQLTNQTVPGVLNMTYNYSGTQNNGRIYNSVDAGADPLVRCRRHGGMAGYCSPLRC